MFQFVYERDIRERAISEGLREGRREGREEGRLEGRLEGSKDERQKNKLIFKAYLSGKTAEEIAKELKLPLDEVKDVLE